MLSLNWWRLPVDDLSWLFVFARRMNENNFLLDVQLQYVDITLHDFLVRAFKILRRNRFMLQSYEIIQTEHTTETEASWLRQIVRKIDSRTE